ncbi:MAG: hypothetical protein JO112_14665 [Planctomycetes bacterium]|nr:hypothetical protein [Planctomycetota bacterium]
MMQRLLVVALAAVGVMFFLSGPSLAAAPPGLVYGQLSSTVSQQPKNTSPVVVEMNSNDALGGLTHSDKEKTGDVVVNEDGVYLMIAACQMGKETGESDEYVDLWLRQNNKDIDNSNCRQAIKDQKFTTVLVSQGISELKKGDVINVCIAVSSPDKGLGIIATKPQGEPVIPSIIFSMYKIK